MNTFKLLTITHKTANINHIGQYIPTANQDKDALAKVLKEVKTALNIDELLYLATCNRLTFLLVTEQEINDLFVIDFFSRLHSDIPQVCLGGLLNVIARYEGIASIRHLFSIAASLDSLVVGEREITRQLREAYNFCNKHQLTGDHIRLAIKIAIPTAKEVYTDTAIGANSVSVVALAIKALLKNKLPRNTRFLIVGAGTTNSTALKILQKYGYHNFHIFNRTLKNAEVLAHKMGGQAYTLEELKDYRAGFDVLISCTGAADAIVTPDLYTSLLAGEKKPRTVIDLAVPNDIHPLVVQQFPMVYIEVEKLRFLAGQNLELRKNEMAKAQTIVLKKAEEFTAMLRNRKIERAMAAIIPHKVKAVKERAMEQVFQKEIEKMDEESRMTLEKVVSYLEKKYIGIPIVAAKEAFAAD